jgi:AcrR family transcriptional regulator
MAIPKRDARKAVSAGTARLGPEAWVRAGLSALVEGGIAAVNVERLAEHLAMTKGSFYWHFENRGALLEAMLDDWERRSTSAIIDELEASGGNAAEKLELLFRRVSRGKGDRLEAALRGWAAIDEQVAKAVARVDRRREKFVVALFEELGFPSAEAIVRTRLVYLAMIGEFTRVAHGAPASPAETWTAFLRLILA